jgi:UDP-4-amino-4,6-dideoxy-N-acetyl-beta-L-altrosamine transaminase
MIPYGLHDISEEDVQAVIEVLRSTNITQGPKVPEFESAIADFAGAHHAVAVNSGTSALHIACLALGIGPGDSVWTTPNTFVASANCIRLCGAAVDFVDIHSATYNLCADKLREKLEQAKLRGNLPKAVVPVHFAGQPCDMKEIKVLAEEYGFFVVEDACHAIGSRYFDETVGGCQYSDITIFSFHPVKIITSIEGGVALTNSAELEKKMQLFRGHGVRSGGHCDLDEDAGDWVYQQVCLGYNYRMTDVQAALGLSQLNRLTEFVASRNMLAERYDKLLAAMPLAVPYQHKYCFSSRHLYVVQLKLDKLERSRKEIFDFMRARSIGVHVHYIPVHTQPYYRELGHKIGDYPNAENYYRRALTIPLFSSMSVTHQDEVVRVLEEALQ